MWLRAMLLCDDVRIEQGGTLSAIGVHGERIQVLAHEGPIIIARLATLTIVAGMLGEESIAWRQTLMADGAQPGPRAELQVHPHDPTTDEHHLVNILSPVQFARAGRYRLAMELQAGDQRVSGEMAFVIERVPVAAA